MSIRQFPLRRWKRIVKGNLPWRSSIHPMGGGKTDSARYCYTVWLHHLVKAHENKLRTDPPVVAEIGPGHSCGTGFAALLTGAERYVAFDVVPYADTKTNLAIFDQLVELFSRREDMLNGEAYEGTPKLTSSSFPGQLLPPERLKRSLEPKRLARLRQAIAVPGGPDSCFSYEPAWYKLQMGGAETADMIFSQATLEHVEDPGAVYGAMSRWLKRGGYMSHAIDFRCHKTAKDWNGHWTYSDMVLRIIRGRRRYSLNCAPYSWHMKCLTQSGVRIVDEERELRPSKIDDRHLTGRLRGKFQPGDFTTAGVFVQAIK